MRLEEAVGFIWRDRRWVEKTVVGAFFSFLSLILIGIPFLAGYWAEVIRQAARGPMYELPEWSNLGRKFSDGLGIIVVGIIWALPAWLILGWAGFMNSIAGDNRFVAVVILCIQCIGWLVGLGLSFVAVSAMIRYATQERLAAAFQVSEVLALIRDHPSRYLMALVASWIVWAFAWVGVILCFVGFLLTAFWALAISGNLYGQVVRDEARPVPPAAL